MEAPAKRKLILAICCGAHGIQDGLGAALYVLMPILAQAFGLNYSQVGMLRATQSCAMFLFELPSGVLSEKFGERRLLVFGLICSGLGYLLLAAATGIWIIAVSFTILGIGSAFQHALSSSIISNSFDSSKRRSALGLYNSSGDAGKLIFTGMLGLAIGISIVWQSVAILFGATSIVFALVLLFTLRRAEVGSAQLPDIADDNNTNSSGWGIQDRASFFNLCTSVFIDTAVQSSFLVFIVFVIADKGVSTQFAAYALVLTLIGGMLGKAVCGYLAQHIGIGYSFAIAKCATAIGIVAILMAPPLAALLLLPVLGIFLQGSTSITYGTISDLIQSDRQSRGFAMVYSVSSLSAIVGPVAFGFISDQSGLDSALMAMAVVSLLAIAPILFLKPVPAQ